MKNYLLMWILLTLLLFAGLYVLLCGWAALPISIMSITFVAYKKFVFNLRNISYNYVQASL